MIDETEETITAMADLIADKLEGRFSVADIYSISNTVGISLKTGLWVIQWMLDRGVESRGASSVAKH